MDIIRQIEAYQPYNEQEARDRAAILQELQTNAAVFERSSVLAHMTASAWTVNAAHDRVLMVYHNIYHSWSWLGGHADGERDLAAVALREVREESGATGVRLALPGIFSIESLTVDGHEKRGAYVSSHLHLNVTYLIEADEGGPLAVKADENSAVRWFGLDEAVAASTEPWFQARVYRKLNEKLRALR
jgi:8-oxo-dGTP pyrophosphatase MutT (NUDIX family)